ncbi:outer membrane protein assembly factor [Acinetobacter sp. WCHAc060033]|uniref:autotransporter assembly complex protein TamA n=1 Tax=Acinetobacter sp. WCHAc060033 TaxID=2518624 RepID=UPI0010230B0F|nr:BamA/TamA family outer membrane protein [Acinetobacter sp. WCHAc060033]RZG82410.1 outer membrane protein assembly factor [Acinetobacter sp. WCHAc060033]
MPAKNQFKKSVLAYSIQPHFDWYHINKMLCASVFLSIFAVPVSNAEQISNSSNPTEVKSEITHSAEQLESAALQQGVSNEKIDQLDQKIKDAQHIDQFDSTQMLQQQQQGLGVQNDFKPIQFEDLEELPAVSIDQSLANEIYQTAEAAKTEAQNFEHGVTKAPEVGVSEATQIEMSEITQAPINVDQLIQTIRADNKIDVRENASGTTLVDRNDSENVEAEQEEKPGFFKRIVNRVRGPQDNGVAIAKISVSVSGAPTILTNNLKAKLGTFTQEAYSDFNGSVPQLRTLAVQAAQAVGYYNAQFKFSKAGDNALHVDVTPNNPVKIVDQNIEFSGAGSKLAQFQVISVLPDLDKGDILHHGAYETMKMRISDAASNNGFFDSYWRLHDVKVEQPQNTAKIDLKYETGERYKLADVEFRMSDPSKPLPIDLKILKTLAPWKDGADYTAWRVNGLANNLTNSRYFNYTLVDAVKPDAIVKPLELPADLQALVDQEKVAESVFTEQTSVEKAHVSNKEVTQNVVNENQFAGTQNSGVNPNLKQLQAQQKEKELDEDAMREQARETKKIPVIVTLNADRLNSLETGIGYGTDTGVRLRGQYRRAIVNHLGHSFDANMELSQIRQSIDARYNIPYKHPLNDYISLVAGYERETRDGIGNDMDLVIESAVAGVDRIIKGSRREWQHILGVRYRLDRVTQDGPVDISNIPDAFLIPGSNQEQQSLLLGYEATKTTSDNRINPTRGYKQSYKIQLGSGSLLSDTDMAITSADWKGLYSFGANDNHQVVGGLNVGYIFAKDFEKVPYNLRYFAGGDQSLRGFDYKSLSPIEYGYKVGGQGLAVGTLEYNYQFKEGWRGAIFSDFGNAYDKSFSNDSEYSLGLGIRWKSPIGPIRLDVASGISDPGHPIRLHFFIGSQL